MWIPGPAGFDGSKKVDELARNASSSECVGPEPYCGISTSLVKARQRLTKRILPVPSETLATKLIHLKNLRILMGLLTSQGLLQPAISGRYRPFPVVSRQFPNVSRPFSFVSPFSIIYYFLLHFLFLGCIFTIFVLHIY